MLKPGDIFEERYQVLEPIGRGGFAKVFRAHQLGTERSVAIKIMLATEDSEDERARLALARLEREVRILSKLTSPHTLTLYDFGITESGHHDVVTEFINGPSLHYLLKHHGKLAADDARRYLRQLAISLREAHALGILHRDIKPHHIMLHDVIGEGAQAKLLDFGIAKPMETDNRDDITADFTLLGTVRYMSPEQIRNKPLIPASDVYSLGLVFYEMLTGQKWTDEHDTIQIINFPMGGVIEHIQGGEQIDARDLDLLRSMLKTNPEERLQDMPSLIGLLDLDDSIDRYPILPVIPMNAEGGDEHTSNTSNASREQVAQLVQPQHKPLLLIAAALGVVLLLSVGAVIHKFGSTNTEVEAPPPAAPEPPRPQLYSIKVATDTPEAKLWINDELQPSSSYQASLPPERFPIKITLARSEDDSNPITHLLDSPQHRDLFVSLPSPAATAEPTPAENTAEPALPIQPKKTRPKKVKVLSLDER